MSLTLPEYLNSIARGSTNSTSSSATARLRCKLAVFANFMDDLAGLSCCKRPGSKLAAVVVPPDLTEVIAIGYNGPAAGEDNMVCRGAEAVGSCGCIHAEANAVLKIRVRHRNLVMLAGLTPCEHCAGLIINSRAVSHYLYGAEYRDLEGLARLRRQGIVALPIKQALGDLSGAISAVGLPNGPSGAPGQPEPGPDRGSCPSDQLRGYG